MVMCMRFLRPALVLMLLAPGVALAQVPPSHGPAEAQLCRSQLELLIDGGKLTEEEVARFEAQCDCLEQRATSGSDAQCTDGELG
ncbi:hypothetical protein DEVEQU_01944 [Devosia equisanguinis]|uniref:SHOCT domain-containing protein n=2 Tax=Devosia equisanguinis TaxID=2490941 RepID=A0A447IBM9_9HYPH|nr:hypothetical protein DEVEQU_01944 [Devosia equisanguinis]